MAVGQSGGGSVGGPSVGFELSQDSVTSPRPADGIPTLEELLGLPPVDVAAPEGALKLEDLCERCSAAQLTSSFAKSSVKFLMDPEAYRAAWGGYCRWLRHAMSRGGGAAAVQLGNLGFMSHRVYTMGIRIPVFTLSEKFKRRHRLTQRSFLESAKLAGDARHAQCPAVWKSNLQPDFNVRVCDCFDAMFSAVLRELDEGNRFVQKSAKSTSI